MQFSSILVAALATVVSAAPVTSEPQTSPADLMTRAVFNQKDFNGFKFQNNNAAFLFGVQNQVNFGFIEQLVQQQFEAQLFAQVFQRKSISANDIFLFGQLSALSNVHGAGLFNGFDLSGLKFNALDWGVLGGFSGSDFNQFIQPDVLVQVNQVVSQTPNIVVIS